MMKFRLFALRPRTVRHIVTRERRAFTAMEMMVALAVFMVLLAAVFVPIKLAGDLSGVGIARATTQQAAVDGIKQIKSDISKAIVILPNDATSGITDKYPYTLNKKTTSTVTVGFPYRRDVSGYIRPATADATGTSNLNACGTVQAVGNTSRLDLILPAKSVTGASVDPNLRSSNVLVTYYARRRDITKAFDPINNPVVLFRAQIPFQYATSGGLQPFPAWETPGVANANLSNQRFDTTSCTPRSLQWLTMNQYGEFDLTRLALPPSNYTPPVPATGVNPTFGSHQLVLPRETALLTPNAASDTDDNNNQAMSLIPDTTFICSDTNKDGKLDTVTIQLSVGQYDENSVNRRTIPTPVGPPNAAAPRSALQPQIARTLTETVFDSNIQ